MARRAKPPKAKVKAKAPRARKSPKSEGSKAGSLAKRLSEALEQQAATSEILRVISQSPTDVQPVFDTIAAAALKLCGASSANVLRVDSELLRLGAVVNVSPEGANAVHRIYPRPITGDNGAGRAVLTRGVVSIPDIFEDPEYKIRETAVTAGFRSVLGVPLMREGTPIGAIVVGRPEPGPFPERQVSLLQTFADQAVIAIENVRLFNELETRNGELTEALEQQTATSGILRVISQSPTDVQPVFDTIAAAALKLCSASSANVFTFDGELVHLAAFVNVDQAYIEALRTLYPRPLSRDTAILRAIQMRSVVTIPDVLEDEDYVPGIGVLATAGRFRSILAVPLMRDGSAIGGIAVGRAEPGPFPDAQVTLLKTFADQAVIAIENVRLFKELELRNRDLTEALEQQTATSQILQVISSSPTSLDPVFDTILQSAMRLCEAHLAGLWRYDGELLRLAAHANASPEFLEFFRNNPMSLSREGPTRRAAMERQVVHVQDLESDLSFKTLSLTQTERARTVLAVPILRESALLGVITMWRREVRPFSERQMALVKTFADQAVIAIENVRLFKELEVRNRDLTEALEHQTATSEILRVISSSPTDAQPVFDIICARARKLCDAQSSLVSRVEGDQVHLAAVEGVTSEGREAIRRYFPHSINAGALGARAIRARSIVHVTDVLADPEYDAKDQARAGGWRNGLAVPMLREGQVIGAIFVGRTAPGRFPDSKVELLKTFADQAVIAIENVRLFTELEKRNRDLTEALEQQTATSEILRVISQSQTDAQPVFEMIAAAALKLCRASSASVATFDGELVHMAALANLNPEGADAYRRYFPRPPGRDTSVTRAVFTRSVVAIPDVLEDPEYAVPTAAVAGGFRSALAVPLMREDSPIGAVFVGRSEPGPFADEQVALLETFADQAVIAIENVRLFTELEARTKQLTRSVGELEALGEVGRAVSSTLDLETVLSTIVSRAVDLAGMDAGAVYEYDESREEFHLHTVDKLPIELAEALRVAPIRKGEGALGRLAVTGEPVEIRDIMDERSYQSRVREILIRLGYRSLLAVPLLREDRLLGGLVVLRNRAGEFAPEVIELLKTFATQSALAIQNARLFREIGDKSRQLEIASRHKSEFLANMSHELRTPLNAIIGFSEVLSERMFGEINDKQAEYLADILESGRHLLSLINDILDLSKIEAGRMELEPTDFDLPNAIENTLILVRERAQRRAITLRRTVDERLGMIRADERKVKQVLLNLLSNALKFTPEGGQIDVRARVEDGVAEISVTDTGVGIAPEDQETVFEEFRQVGTAARKVEGTGLGLAISRKFIELHGGRIRVESQIGSGSTFTFTLPLTIDESRPAG